MFGMILHQVNERIMKRILPGCLLVWAGTVGVMAATVPIHINEVDIVVPTDPLPTINARAFVNQSTFSVISRLWQVC